MKKILLLLVMSSLITVAFSQKRKKPDQPLMGYAITSIDKGGRSWKEVRLINITTGEEIKSIYTSKQETEAYNARTGLPVQKKNMATPKSPEKKVVNLDQALANGNNTRIRTMVINGNSNEADKPFATNSAAMAYDKKHERLYYTPMGINQLRYIDLKANKVYYFENESFGSAKHAGDGANQICRMAIASDGHGYALTNDGNHLIKFTTDKNPVITDLGALVDDASNAKTSIHSRKSYGGDMIADAQGNLYVLTANRNVFKVSVSNKIATYLGSINGLPEGFSTNGAMVEEGSKVIVASSESSVGYYRFDLITLQAEKVSMSPSVFNASDLANEKLAFAKKKKDRRNQETPEQKAPAAEEASRRSPRESIGSNGISVFPNPVINRLIKVSFANQPSGRYSVDLIDITGKLIQSKEVNINNSQQVEEVRIPKSVNAGNYILRVSGIGNAINLSNKIVIQ